MQAFCLWEKNKSTPVIMRQNYSASSVARHPSSVESDLFFLFCFVGIKIVEAFFSLSILNVPALSLAPLPDVCF